MRQRHLNYISPRLCVFASLRERTSRKAHGFTLIELILVMAIIAIALACTAPLFRGFMDNQTNMNTVNRILALARHARALAISEGRTYRLNVDTIAGTYWIDALDGTDFKEIGTGSGQHFKLPEGMKATWEPPPAVLVNSTATMTIVQTVAGANTLPGASTAPVPNKNDNEYVQFFSDGRSEMSSLKLKVKDKDEIELGTPSETEMWRMVKEGQP